MPGHRKRQRPGQAQIRGSPAECTCPPSTLKNRPPDFVTPSSTWVLDTSQTNLTGEGDLCEARAHQAVLGCLRGVPYACAVESDEPIVLQHSRLDTSAGAYTLFTTSASGE